MRGLQCLAGWLMAGGVVCFSQTTNVNDYGVKPNGTGDSTAGVLKAIGAAKQGHSKTLIFPKGRYDFYPEQAQMTHYFITNHDHVEQRAVAMPLEGVSGLTLDGQGSEFVFHGVMMPISLVGGSGVTLKNFSIDYAQQHFLFTKVLTSAKGAATTVEVLPDQKYTVADGHLTLFSDGWTKPATVSLELDPKTMTLAVGVHDDYQFSKVKVRETAANQLELTGMPQVATPGNVMVFRGNDRPQPAIWVSESKEVTVSHVNVYGAQGMAFTAQKSADLHLDAVNVVLPEGKGRLLTTNADALHFANCRGKITVENGLYENMLDDGINVHAVVLRVAELKAPRTMLLEWGHIQTFGWTFAAAGEQLEFVSTRTLLPLATAKVTAVERVDDKHLLVTLDGDLPASVKVDDLADNMTWRPSQVVYRNNTVRRIRSRGVLFSVPAGVLIEGNHFDKTTGAAILIPGEASKWFEGTPSSDVIIRGNTITDAELARGNQAAIVIGPTVGAPDAADGYVHRHILIEGNDFKLLGRHVVQGLSVDGLVFRGNKLAASADYPSVSGDKTPVLGFVHSKCVEVGKNELPFTMTAADVTGSDLKLLKIDGLAGMDAGWTAACSAETKF